MASDSELIDFCTELIERSGGVVDSRSPELPALLSARLAQALEVPEEVRLDSEKAPLLYGSPFLDRLIGFATGEVPVAYGQIQPGYLKKAGFEQLFGRDISFVDGLVRITGRAEARATYMVLTSHYLALSDERKEGLVQVAIQESSGAFIDGFEELLGEFQPLFFPPGMTPSHFPVHLERSLQSGMRRVKNLVREQLSDFLASMERRLRRDAANTREYYEALAAEMEASLSHPNLAEAQRQERLAKISELPAEMARKIEDLEQKYQVRISIAACAAERFLVDVVQLLVEVKYRKLSRSLRVTWNPITRGLDPLVCEQCRETVHRVYPFPHNSEIRLLCSRCSRKGMVKA